MVLSGDGGDELFAGYYTYQRWLQLTDPDYPGWKKILYPFARQIYPGRFPMREHSLQSWLGIIAYFHEKQRCKIWRKEYQALAEGPINEFIKEYSRTVDFSALGKVQYMDMKTYLPNDILVKIDIASMIHGLESRTPLVDHKVAEFAATIPSSIYMNASGTELSNGKFLLKKLLGKYFPDDFINRKKMGFGIPVQKWFSSNSIWKERVEQSLNSSNSLLHEYFNQNYIKFIIEKNESGKIWLLLVLEEWLRQFHTRKS